MKQARKTFTAQDDEELTRLVGSFSGENWAGVAENMTHGFTSRQCRERWKNYLDPRLKNVPWTDDEDARLLDAYERIGRRWTVIAAIFPGRSGNTIRNRLFLLLRKKDKCPTPLADHAPAPAAIRPDKDRFTNLFPLCDSEHAADPDRDALIGIFFHGQAAFDVDGLFSRN
jgi:hypothetical protein